MRSSARRSRVRARRSNTLAPRNSRRRCHLAVTEPIRRTRPPARVAIAPRPAPIRCRPASTSRHHRRRSSDRNGTSPCPSSLRKRPRSSTIPTRRYRPSGRRYKDASHASDWPAPTPRPNANGAESDRAVPALCGTRRTLRCGLVMARNRGLAASGAKQVAAASASRWVGGPFVPAAPAQRERTGWQQRP